MNQSKTFIVAGAGFRGFCDCLELLKIPNSKIHLIEPAPFFGGVLNSFEYNGFAIDKGVHFFDSIAPKLGDIITEIMDGQVRTVDFVSASAFNGKVTEGYSLPDLNSLSDENLKLKIKNELLAATRADTQTKPNNLYEVFIARYSQTAGEIFAQIFEKIYAVDSHTIEPNVIDQTSLGRLKFLEDEEMLKLKKSDPWLDNVLAARRTSFAYSNDTVSLYPDTGEAMKGWCDRAVIWLKAKGVNIHLGESINKIEDNSLGVTVTTSKQVIDADYVIWSNDNIKSLGTALNFRADGINDFLFGTPLVFVSLFTHANKIKDFTYLQNFDCEKHFYRTAAAGVFSRQIKNDLSFITSECPAPIGSHMWCNPESYVTKVWEECKHFGIVASNAKLIDSKVVKVPITYKLGKVGYTKKIDEFVDCVRSLSQRVIFRNVEPFYRKDIYLDSLNLRNLIDRV